MNNIIWNTDKLMYWAKDSNTDAMAEGPNFRPIYKFAMDAVKAAARSGKRTRVNIGITNGRYRLDDKYSLYNYPLTDVEGRVTGSLIFVEERARGKALFVKEMRVKR